MTDFKSIVKRGTTWLKIVYEEHTTFSVIIIYMYMIIIVIGPSIACVA